MVSLSTQATGYGVLPVAPRTFPPQLSVLKEQLDMELSPPSHFILPWRQFVNFVSPFFLCSVHLDKGLLQDLAVLGSDYVVYTEAYLWLSFLDTLSVCNGCEVTLIYVNHVIHSFGAYLDLFLQEAPSIHTWCFKSLPWRTT